MKQVRRMLAMMLAVVMVVGMQAVVVLASENENMVRTEEKLVKTEESGMDVEKNTVTQDERDIVEETESIEAYAGIEGVEEYAEGVSKSGTCGDNLTWTLSDDGILTISGNGSMRDYTNEASGSSVDFPNPFAVRKVVIENGVTSIGDYAFEWFH